MTTRDGPRSTLFYPRDDMLARVLDMALYLSVCVRVCLRLSQVGVLSKGIDGFWHGGLFRPVIHCVLRKFRYLQKLEFFHLESFSYTLDLENFATSIAYRSSKRVINLARSTAVVYHNDRQALSTARFCRAGNDT